MSGRGLDKRAPSACTHAGEATASWRARAATPDGSAARSCWIETSPRSAYTQEEVRR